jgi:hypothetical protein
MDLSCGFDALGMLPLPYLSAIKGGTPSRPSKNVAGELSNEHILAFRNRHECNPFTPASMIRETGYFD